MDLKDLHGSITDGRPKKVKFIVFGESYSFWKEYHNLLKIENDNVGLMINYANLYKEKEQKQCWACLNFSNVEGVYTMFVDPCGAYQDYLELESFCFNLCGLQQSVGNYTEDIHHHIAWSKLDNQERKKRLAKDAKIRMWEAMDELEGYLK